MMHTHSSALVAIEHAVENRMCGEQDIFTRRAISTYMYCTVFISADIVRPSPLTPFSAPKAILKARIVGCSGEGLTQKR